jgi:hypothetical protein
VGVRDRNGRERSEDGADDHSLPRNSESVRESRAGTVSRGVAAIEGRGGNMEPRAVGRFGEKGECFLGYDVLSLALLRYAVGIETFQLVGMRGQDSHFARESGARRMAAIARRSNA